MWGGREHRVSGDRKSGHPTTIKKTIKQNNIRNYLHSVRRLMFIMIGEMKNFNTSISGILFGDNNVRKTSGKVTSSDGRARKEKNRHLP